MQDLPVDDLLTVDQAIERIDAHPVAPRSLIRSLDDAQLVGSVLAEDVHADRDEPAADRSLMDGYAIAAADLAAATLRVAGAVRAGSAWDVPLAAGECVSIMTGAPLPRAAAAVVPIEHVHATDDRIHILQPPKHGQAVAKAASYLAKGAVVLPAGSIITPAAVGLLAAVGACAARVFDRPRVGVLTSGDEIVPPAALPRIEQTRNAVAPMLRALIARLGYTPIDIGHAGDTPDDLRAHLRRARDCDVLLAAGGMSVGTHDHVPPTLAALGYAMPVTKLRIKPGKPFVFATRPRNADDGPPIVFGLPGNPVSGFVCTLLLAARLLRRLAGRPAATIWHAAPLADDLPTNGPRAFYQPARLRGNAIDVLEWKGSADLRTLAEANILIRRPANDRSRQAGDTVDYTELP